MSAVSEWLLAVFAISVVINVYSISRTLRRQDRRIRELTRRVWKLEGCPRGDA